ncbi:phosphonate C-P lyase system protein PhnL [Salinibius halmophilus]|uniref:phosphonate C-P lyase system protein PhnL n=1 Tax=Salinibius halmophilus TaxID=1853216 RepID=UPI000E665281|nr:phosphonate C-P lyase system protein PhnL [Salinibius halmophilus]
MIRVNQVSKQFTLHNQGGVELSVLQQASFSVAAGECVVLHGPSGSGKSTLLRSLYGNYLIEQGSVQVRHQGQWLELAGIEPRTMIALRRQTLGWVSQFLRVIPRTTALEIVMQPAIEAGLSRAQAKQRSEEMLARLNVPESLWHLAPATFSGGEQQRVNIASGFVVDHPILLLDEPTASLDEQNREVVIELIEQAKQRGAAIVGIFHDAYVRNRVADRLYHLAAQGANS